MRGLPLQGHEFRQTTSKRASKEQVGRGVRPLSFEASAGLIIRAGHCVSRCPKGRDIVHRPWFRAESPRRIDYMNFLSKVDEKDYNVRSVGGRRFAQRCSSSGISKRPT